MSDLYQQVQDQEERISQLENNQSDRDFSYDSMKNITDFMEGNFWYHGVVAMGGASSKQITLPGVSSSSVAIISVQSAGTTFSYGAVPTQDTLTITASGATSDTIAYLVFI